MGEGGRGAVFFEIWAARPRQSWRQVPGWCRVDDGVVSIGAARGRVAGWALLRARASENRQLAERQV